MSNLGNFAQYAVQGIPLGCVFALLAVGLTLNYKTSGVFNLAFAAQAFASAAVFYVLRKEHAWNLLPAAFVAVVVFGTAMAWILDRLIYRHQRTASALAKLVIRGPSLWGTRAGGTSDTGHSPQRRYRSAP